MSGTKSGKKSLVKKKSLFDHVNQVTAVQNPNYWEDISDEDKKTWSNYMVNRFLSMKPDWIDLVNEIQKYPLEPKQLYKSLPYKIVSTISTIVCISYVPSL